MTRDNETPLQAAIRGLQERAEAREAAARHLQLLAESVGAKPVVRGLVVLELQDGVRRMLNEQMDFLRQAEQLKRQAAGLAQGRLL